MNVDDALKSQLCQVFSQLLAEHELLHRRHLLDELTTFGLELVDETIAATWRWNRSRERRP